jgi:hypothetical protein
MGIDTIDSEKQDPPTRELQEKDFIQENYSKNPRPFWAMVAIFACVVAVCWGIGSWYYQAMETQQEESPFLQVTNRDMSVFLWQFPEYMPQHVKDKTGYLPGFEYRERIGVNIKAADDYVEAPPGLLFLYHTWSRLLKGYYIPRPISRVEFAEFLDRQPEWRPENWPDAPLAYQQMVLGIKFSRDKNIENLPIDALPIIVRQSFQGWKNYRLEGELVNIIKITYSELEQFLNKFPHYKRNFWRNIVYARYPSYLLTYTYEKFQGNDKVPEEEIAPFLRVAIFNAIQVKKGF